MRVRLGLGSSEGLESADKDLNWPLHVASEMGHAEIIKVHLDSKADCSSKNKDLKTPLDLAKETGYTQAA